MKTKEWKEARHKALKVQTCLDYIVRSTAKQEIQGVVNKYALGFTAAQYKDHYGKAFTRDQLSVAGLTRVASLELAVAKALKEEDQHGQVFKKEAIRIAYQAAWEWAKENGKPEVREMLLEN